MPGIAQCLFKALAHPALECFRQSRGAARGVERYQRRKSGDIKILRLSQRIDHGQLSFAQNACRLDVFIDQPFDREHELIVEWRCRLLRKTAYINAQRVGVASQTANEFAAQNGRHARRDPAIRRQGHATLFGSLRQRQLLTHHRVVAAQIGEMATRFDRSARQSEVQKIGHRRKRSVVSAHHLHGGLFIAGIKRACANFFLVCDPIHPHCYFAGALGVAVHQRHRIHLRRAGHIERRRRTHHAGTNY